MYTQCYIFPALMAYTAKMAYVCNAEWTFCLAQHKHTLALLLQICHINTTLRVIPVYITVQYFWLLSRNRTVFILAAIVNGACHRQPETKPFKQKKKKASPYQREWDQKIAPTALCNVFCCVLYSSTTELSNRYASLTCC